MINACLRKETNVIIQRKGIQLKSGTRGNYLMETNLIAMYMVCILLLKCNREVSVRSVWVLGDVSKGRSRGLF
jgi:hypothetical protein